MNTPVFKEPRKSAVIFIFITVVLDMLALGVIIPVLPKLVVHFLQGDTPRAAQIYGLFGTIWALMHFLCSPLLGALSDRFGRRPVILISNFGMGLDYLLMALAPSLGWLFVGRLVSGVTASSITAASAYIADVTPPEKRAAGFGMLGAAFGIGFILGPAVGGLLGSVNPHFPFLVAAILSLLNAVYGLFVLPESLPVERRTPKLDWKSANPVGALQLLRSHGSLMNISIINFLGYLAHCVLPSVFVLYSTYRYHWTERAVGLTLTAVGVCSAIVQSTLVGPIVRRLGEQKTLILGLVFGVVGFAIYGWAPSGELFLLGIPVMALWGLCGPAAQGLMTQRVGQNEQGQLQGAVSSLRGIAELVGPGLFTLTFSFSIRGGEEFHSPGAPFYLASLILFGALLQTRGFQKETPGRSV